MLFRPTLAAHIARWYFCPYHVDLFRHPHGCQPRADRTPRTRQPHPRRIRHRRPYCHLGIVRDSRCRRITASLSALCVRTCYPVSSLVFVSQCSRLQTPRARPIQDKGGCSFSFWLIIFSPSARHSLYVRAVLCLHRHPLHRSRPHALEPPHKRGQQSLSRTAGGEASIGGCLPPVGAYLR